MSHPRKWRWRKRCLLARQSARAGWVRAVALTVRGTSGPGAVGAAERVEGRAEGRFAVVGDGELGEGAAEEGVYVGHGGGGGGVS